MKKRYFATVLVVIFFADCKKGFLDIEPKDTPVRESYINNLNACEEFLNGNYATLSDRFFNGYNVLYSDVASDNLDPVPGTNAYFAQYSWSQLSTEPFGLRPNYFDVNMNSLWGTAYLIARNCNYILENIDKYRTENPTKADNIKGQALAMRALVYHQLMNVFAQPLFFTGDGSHPGIPYDLGSDFTRPFTSRQSVKENYDQLVNDLTQAISLLPVQQTRTFFISGTAARALLCRIQLFKRNFSEAASLASNVFQQASILSTPDYPSKLYTLADKESLLQIPPSVSATGSYNTTFPSVYFRRAATVQFVASTDIVNLIQQDPLDVRKNWLAQVSAQWRIVKFPVSIVAGINVAENSYYLSVIRASETALSAAEAYAQLGKTDSAYKYLDLIRKRSNPNVSATTATGTALLDSIYNERRKELCFEGIRLFDLLRLGKPVVRSASVSSAGVYLAYPSPKAIAPLPQLDVIQYSLSQNESY